MRRKKKALNQRYNKLIKQAWDNEFILRRFQNMELRLMQCESLTELIQVLLIECKEKFELEIVSLSLFDPESEMQQSLQMTDPIRKENFPHLSFDFDAGRHLKLFDANGSPRLCPYNPDLHADLFQHSSQPIKSIALLLLKRDTRIIGSLNLGDCKTDRFRSNSATDFLQHLGAVISVCIDMAILHDKLRNIGLKDVLTGINNRRYFDERLPEEISRSQRYKKPLSCLFIDVDHFKQFNDNYGHASGDQVLKQVAHIIRQNLRATDVLGRYGGEEFAVLLIETDAANARDVAERIRQNIQNHHIELEGKSMQITVSIGVSGYQQPVDTSQPVKAIGASLIATADGALYKAKQAGRNRVICGELSA